MCGIIACRTSGSATDYLLEALRSLEYRGYDSVGLAVRGDDGEVRRARSTRRTSDLAARVAALGFAGTAGVGHTRWATHGVVNEQNAHPHQDCSGGVNVVHNGIIENAPALRARLVADGHRFTSDVDSEVICHLIEEGARRGGDLLTSVLQATSEISGSWAFVVLESATGRLIGAATHSPLVVGHSPHGDFLASDVAAIAPWCEEYRVVEDGSVVDLTGTGGWLRKGRPVKPPAPVSTSWTGTAHSLEDGQDNMGAEIAEQPQVTGRLLDTLLPSVADGSLWRELDLRPFTRLRVLGCGTSLNAGRVIAGCLRSLGGMPSTIEVASEFVNDVIEPGTLTLAISQSGETADVLNALDSLDTETSQVLALTNNPHSSLARRARAVIECSAGTEVGVAATKTFVCQVVAGACLAVSSLVALGRLDTVSAHLVADYLARTPERLGRAIDIAQARVPALLDGLLDDEGFIFLGRGSAVPYAAEGALKLKELAYRWAEHYPAGELKHGPLALVDAGTPVIVIDNGDPRLAGNIAEVMTRGARVIEIGGSGSPIPVIDSGIAPLGPLEAVVPLQLLARLLALTLGRDVDKPRNLAKSVTVL